MRKPGAVILAGLIAGLSFTLPALAQTSPPPRPAPSEARARAICDSTLKQIIEHYKKGFDLTHILCRNVDADLPAWRVAAGKNDPDGQLILGLCNYYGIGGAQNRDRGFDLIKKAADKGDADSMAVLGILLKNGDIDHAPDIEQSLAYTTRAADLGHPLALDQLAINASDDQRRIGQFEQAIATLDAAAKEGNLNAMCKLGLVKLDGWMQALDQEGGVALLTQAANAGHVRALYELGNVYVSGSYVKPNKALGQQLIHAAASTGFIPAMFVASGTSESGAIQQRAATARERDYFRQLEASRDPLASLMLYTHYAKRVYPGESGFDEKVADRAMDAARRGVPQAYPYASRLYRLGTPKYPKDLEKARTILQYGVDALDPESTYEMALAFRHGYFEPANEEKALAHFEAAAALGVPPAMTRIGDCARDGRGLPRDLNQAYRAYLSGAFAGDPESMYAIARATAYGEGVEVSAEKAEFWAKMAIERRHANGYFILYELCRLGIGRPANHVQGIEFLIKGAKEGGRLCAVRFGELLVEGTAIPRDLEAGIGLLEKLVEGDLDGSVRVMLARYYLGAGTADYRARALELAQKSAELGNSDAWTLLGFIKANGLVGEANWGEAVDCYSKAISLGNAHAMLNLGTHYLEGKVTQRDPERAIELWTDAVNQGMSKASVYITKAYFGFLGKEVTNEAEAVKWAEKAIELKEFEVCAIAGSYYSLNTDYISARKWLQRGIELGETNCYNDMGILYRFGRGVEQSDSESARYYRLGHEKGNFMATANLATCYEEGRGVPQDFEESMRLAQLAADNGEATAMLFIGRKYVDGIGVTRDFNKGIEWIRKSANAGNATAKNMIAAATEKGLIK